MENYYETLGVSSDADIHTIKKAYHKLAKQYHPDSPDSKKTPKARERFGLIKEAYETLRDKELRKTYDKYMLKKPLRSQEDKNDSYVKKFYERGRKLYMAKNFLSASRAFQTALNLDRDNALYCSWLGLTFSNMPGRLHDAKKWCEKAIELSPYNSDYLVNLAIVYKDAGIKSMAEKFFTKAIKLDPGNKRAHTWLKEIKGQPSFKGVLKDFLSRKKQ